LYSPQIADYYQLFSPTPQSHYSVPVSQSPSQSITGERNVSAIIQNTVYHFDRESKPNSIESRIRDLLYNFCDWLIVMSLREHRVCRSRPGDADDRDNVLPFASTPMKSTFTTQIWVIGHVLIILRSSYFRGTGWGEWREETNQIFVA